MAASAVAPTPEAVVLSLRLGTNLLAVLEEEGAAMQHSATQFLRALLRRKMGVQILERAATAPKRKLLGPKEPKKALLQVTLAGDLYAFLDEISCRMGGVDKLTVVAHLILDWAGISPLAKGADVRMEAPKEVTVSRRHVTSQAQKQTIFQIGAPIHSLLAEEAKVIGVRSSELLRDILRAKGGLAVIERAPSAPPRKVLANIEHEREKLSVYLPLDQIAFLDELANRLGGATKSAILSHLILDFAGISPLNLPYPFEPKKEGRSRS